MLVHDAFSSVGVTLALLSTTAVSTRWGYAGRVGSLAEFRRTDLSLRDRLIDAARQAVQLPWFARNLAIKCLIVVKLGRLTRLLGHRGRLALLTGRAADGSRSVSNAVSACFVYPPLL